MRVCVAHYPSGSAASGPSLPCSICCKVPIADIAAFEVGAPSTRRSRLLLMVVMTSDVVLIGNLDGIVDLDTEVTSQCSRPLNVQARAGRGENCPCAGRSTAFERRNECVPTFAGSSPMLATHSRTELDHPISALGHEQPLLNPSSRAQPPPLEPFTDRIPNSSILSTREPSGISGSAGSWAISS